MSIIFNVEEWETKGGAFKGFPAMKLQLGPLEGHYLNLAQPNSYEGTSNWACDAIIPGDEEEALESLLLE